jgi:hypothetical protein
MNPGFAVLDFFIQQVIPVDYLSGISNAPGSFLLLDHAYV